MDINSHQDRNVDPSDSGDQSSVWNQFWHGLTPEGEVRMWDFFGGDRPWILQHVPRYGKVLEAGCGLGRYVVYLSRLGIDIEGLDFHEPTVRAVREWCTTRGLLGTFRLGDVRSLPYIDESLSGYISLGVIEHFQEGPAKALAEAFRVLKPGGIAIISVPSASFAWAYSRLKRLAKQRVKRVLGFSPTKEIFFQYWYSPKQLRSWVNASGLRVVLSSGCDLRYSFWELVHNSPSRNFWFRLADLLERTPLREWGGCAVVIAVKMSQKMHCFLCGEKKVNFDDMGRHYLPICDTCAESEVAKYYAGKRRPRFTKGSRYDPPILTQTDPATPCFFCSTPVQPDPLFEYYGFGVPVCPICLQTPMKNIVASSDFLQSIWRPRTSNPE